MGRMLSILDASCLALAMLLFTGTAWSADHVMLIGGLGGDAKYSRDFGAAIVELQSALAKGGYDPRNIRVLAEKGSALQGAEESTADNIKKEFEALKRAMAPTDTFLLVMLGHGQSDYQEPRFNLPGPDLTARGLRAFLDALPAKDQRCILMFPCSGHFSEILAAPDRTLLSSTDGPRQIYSTICPRFLLKGLAKQAADLNGDHAISFTEMFEFLSNETKSNFEMQGQVATETPALDDNGDGKVTARAEGLDAGDGARAANVILLPAPGAARERKTP